MSQEGLENIRREITALDHEIVTLLNKRMGFSKEVASAKAGSGAAVYDPVREHLLLDGLTATLGPEANITPEILQSIYREIISGSIKLQQPLTVAYLGPAGTYSEEAVRTFYGSQVTTLPKASSEEIGKAVMQGTSEGGADFGVLPIENSIQGVVLPALDMLAESSLVIGAEIKLPIHHYLLSKDSLSTITQVFSHDQALAQCSEWLRANLPGAEWTPVSSTAHAAELAQSTPRAAAISSKRAAELYNLPILAAQIENRPDNSTRFLVISKEALASRPTGHDKTSITFLAADKPGSLLEVLQVFEHHKINLTMIQSRPGNQPWQYRFFLDFDGHRDDTNVVTAFSELEKLGVRFRVMGSYPVGV